MNTFKEKEKEENKLNKFSLKPSVKSISSYNSLLDNNSVVIINKTTDRLVSNFSNSEKRLIVKSNTEDKQKIFNEQRVFSLSNNIKQSSSNTINASNKNDTIATSNKSRISSIFDFFRKKTTIKEDENNINKKNSKKNKISISQNFIYKKAKTKSQNQYNSYSKKDSIVSPAYSKSKFNFKSEFIKTDENDKEKIEIKRNINTVEDSSLNNIDKNNTKLYSNSYKTINNRINDDENTTDLQSYIKFSNSNHTDQEINLTNKGKLENKLNLILKEEYKNKLNRNYRSINNVNIIEQRSNDFLSDNNNNSSRYLANSVKRVNKEQNYNNERLLESTRRNIEKNNSIQSSKKSDKVNSKNKNNDDQNYLEERLESLYSSLRSISSNSISMTSYLSQTIKTSPSNSSYNLSNNNNTTRTDIISSNNMFDNQNLNIENDKEEEYFFEMNNVHKQLLYNTNPRKLKPLSLVYDSLSDIEEEDNYNSNKYLPQNFYKWDNPIVVTVKAISSIALLTSLIFCSYFSAFNYKINSEIEFSYFLIYLIISIASELILIFEVIFSLFIIKDNENNTNIVTNFFSLLKQNFSYIFIISIFSVIPVHSIFSITSFFSLYSDNFINSSLLKVKLKSSSIIEYSNIFLSSLRWLRLFGLVRISDYSHYLSNYYNYNIKGITHTIIVFIVYIHASSCLFIFIGYTEIEFFKDNWISFNSINDISEAQLYLISLYFNVVTIFTVGYGDICPVSLIEKAYMIAVLGISCSAYSIVLSSLSAHFNQEEKNYSFLIKKREILTQLNSEYTIPDSINTKIMRYIESYKKLSANRNELFEILPTKLKSELINKMFGNTIKNLSLFSDTPEEYNSYILTLLKPMSYDKNELVFQVGSFFTDIIFIAKGSLKFNIRKIIENKSLESRRDSRRREINKFSKFYTLHTGENFGEINMLLNESIDYDIYTSNLRNTSLLVLSQKDFILVKANYPSLVKIQIEKALKLYQHINLKKNLCLFTNMIKNNKLSENVVLSSRKNNNKDVPSNLNIYNNDTSNKEEIYNNKNLNSIVKESRPLKSLCSAYPSPIISNKNDINITKNNNSVEFLSIKTILDKNLSMLLKNMNVDNVHNAEELNQARKRRFSKIRSHITNHDSILKNDLIKSNIINDLPSSIKVKRNSDVSYILSHAKNSALRKKSLFKSLYEPISKKLVRSEKRCNSDNNKVNVGLKNQLNPDNKNKYDLLIRNNNKDIENNKINDSNDLNVVNKISSISQNNSIKDKVKFNYCDIDKNKSSKLSPDYVYKNKKYLSNKTIKSIRSYNDNHNALFHSSIEIISVQEPKSSDNNIEYQISKDELICVRNKENDKENNNKELDLKKNNKIIYFYGSNNNNTAYNSFNNNDNFGNSNKDIYNMTTINQRLKHRHRYVMGEDDNKTQGYYYYEDFIDSCCNKLYFGEIKNNLKEKAPSSINNSGFSEDVNSKLMNRKTKLIRKQHKMNRDKIIMGRSYLEDTIFNVNYEYLRYVALENNKYMSSYLNGGQNLEYKKDAIINKHHTIKTRSINKIKKVTITKEKKKKQPRNFSILINSNFNNKRSVSKNDMKKLLLSKIQGDSFSIISHINIYKHETSSSRTRNLNINKQEYLPIKNIFNESSEMSSINKNSTTNLHDPKKRRFSSLILDKDLLFSMINRKLNNKCNSNRSIINLNKQRSKNSIPLTPDRRLVRKKSKFYNNINNTNKYINIKPNSISTIEYIDHSVNKRKDKSKVQSVSRNDYSNISSRKYTYNNKNYYTQNNDINVKMFNSNTSSENNINNNSNREHDADPFNSYNPYISHSHSNIELNKEHNTFNKRHSSNLNYNKSKENHKLSLLSLNTKDYQEIRNSEMKLNRSDLKQENKILLNKDYQDAFNTFLTSSHNNSKDKHSKTKILNLINNAGFTHNTRNNSNNDIVESLLGQVQANDEDREAQKLDNYFKSFLNKKLSKNKYNCN